ncbi:hypothetical protein SAMN05880561_101520 [Rhizobium sp. RU33A]|uniref:hypothetical protein n=1 Tax=Rhizobium sp. RU33A TaxID=1907413 RepID=UPI000954CA31|nr:hypothetical protein [Rhizobium sp. RU33A]SIP97194.1 hypothetical protein SAMN05880561_101520 [Rhizobium sp. RU33A]
MTKDRENKGETDGGQPEGQPLADRGKRTLSDAEARRRERAAAKLRENLARRKQQSRARRAGEAEDGIGLPAAHSASVETIAEVEGGEGAWDNANPVANSPKPGD